MGGDQEPVVTVDVIRHSDKKYEASARQGEYKGWAIQKTEQLAKGKALHRLRADVEGWFR